MLKKGQVIKVISGFFDVKTKDNLVYRLRGSGSLRTKKLLPIVGDYVLFKEDLILCEIEKRNNYLIRPKVANVDQVVIVMSLSQPSFSYILLDKFLAIIQYQEIDVIIVFTKMDLGDNKPYFDYVSQGFKCFLINNLLKNENFIDLKNELKNKLNVFTGQSGVGKTSLLNNLLNLNEKTNDISLALGRGKHTTRVVEIFELDDIKIIDTPGFGKFDLELTKSQLSTSFFDFKIWSKKCKFISCLHFKEEDCEVKRQYQNGSLLKTRYENYIKMLMEAKK